MSRTLFRIVPAFVLVAAGIAWLTPRTSGQAGYGAFPSTKNGEWPTYTADLRGSKYSPLDQVNAANFSKMEVAWRFKTDSLGPRPEYKLEGTPLMVKGIVYTTAGTRRSVVALDGRTGELIWSHSYREGARAAIAPRQLSGRGLSYWTDGKGDDRVIYVTTGYRLIELNAQTGQMIPSFGKSGVLDLKEGVVFGNKQPIDLQSGEIGVHSAPLVVKDVVIVGSAFREGMTVVTHNNTKGIARAFDVRTGRLLWTFNTIPRPGEFGNETWEGDSWAVNGNTGVWSQITVDEDLGLVYLPVEDPTSDFYGGHRPGNNLYGDSIVCVDLKTGQRKWHFQIVHHPIWDMDMSSAPLLVDAVVNGAPRKLVAQPTKQGWLYVFDRVTGQPIWPMPETPVPQSDVPGEKTSPTQPIPTKPPPYSRATVTTEDLIDFTTELRTQALENLKNYRWEQQPFGPPSLGSMNGKRGTITIGYVGGGINWPGAGFDPETATFYGEAANAGVSALSLRPPPAGFSDLRYISGIDGSEFRVAEGPGYGSAADYQELGKAIDAASGRAGAPPEAPAAVAPAGRGGRGAPPATAAPAPAPAAAANLLQPGGFSIVKPPYGVVAAIDLNTGEMKWRVPHGDTPDAVRAGLQRLGITNVPKTGQTGSVGLLITKTLVIAGDPQATTTPEHPRGAMLRAYNKQTGEQVGAVLMPAPQSGSPMTYAIDGKQYIIVAVSGGNYSGEYIAFSVPTGDRPNSQGGQQ